MKRTILGLLFLTAPFVVFAEKPNPADFTLNVHVLSSAQVIQPSYGGESSSQVLEVTIDGLPMQLTELFRKWLLTPGDYRARVMPPFKGDGAKPYDVDRTYELLMPDGSTRKYQLTRIGPAPCR